MKKITYCSFTYIIELYPNMSNKPVTHVYLIDPDFGNAIREIHSEDGKLFFNLNYPAGKFVHYDNRIELDLNKFRMSSPEKKLCRGESGWCDIPLSLHSGERYKEIKIKNECYTALCIDLNHVVEHFVYMN